MAVRKVGALSAKHDCDLPSTWDAKPGEIFLCDECGCYWLRCENKFTLRDWWKRLSPRKATRYLAGIAAKNPIPKTQEPFEG